MPIMESNLLLSLRKLTTLLVLALVVSVYSGISSNTWKDLSTSNFSTQQVSHHVTHDVHTVSLTQKQIPTLHNTDNHDGLWYAPATNQRCLSMAEIGSDVDPPAYALVAELPHPIHPLFSYDFASALPRDNWALLPQTRSLRLNGWKQSNLQYRFIQQA